jgi:hypothetical protein
LAAIAACCSAVFGAVAFGAPFLLLGALVQPWARTTGRWLMWFGAIFLIWPTVMGSAFVFEQLIAGRLGDTVTDRVFPLFVISTILLYWCDIALTVDAFRNRHRWLRGSLDCLVWIVALAPSIWCVWLGILRYPVGRIDIFFTGIGIDALVLSFDAALIVHAVRTWTQDRPT